MNATLVLFLNEYNFSHVYVLSYKNIIGTLYPAMLYYYYAVYESTTESLVTILFGILLFFHSSSSHVRMVVTC